MKNNYFIQLSRCITHNFTSDRKIYGLFHITQWLSILYLCSGIFTNSATAQTTLIASTGDGGFETGATFASNGWTATTGAATANQWVCNTGATGFTGARSAYVTNNTAGVPPPNSYTITPSISNASHIYRNVAVPAGETQITLNFSWKGLGELNYDRLRVWLVPTTYNPLFGTAVTATGTAPTGRVQVGLAQYVSQAAWTNAVITIPSSYAGTAFRLVFEWVNDTTVGSQPPVAIDNISLVSLTPAALTNDNCSGAVALTVNGTTTCSISTAGTTITATQSQIGCAGTADDDVWYSFTATGATHDLIVTPGSLYDAVFEVFSGTCGALVSMGCVDGTLGASNEAATATGLTIGAVYYVRVYSYYNAAIDQGTFSICITTPVPLTNDNCATAGVLTVNPTTSCAVSTSGTTIGATQSMPGCSGSADDDVWYSFVATSTTHNIAVTPGTLYDPVVEVFSGSCGILTSIICLDNIIGSGTESTTLNGLTVGLTYYIRIYSWWSGFDQGTFSVCVTTEIPCTAGSGTGTTSLGCPSVISGGLGLNGADPAPISCTSGSCVDLEATYLQLGQTTDYTVEAIPYAPPYQFGCLANPVSVNIDDVWSPVVNLPFNFCFYGSSYNQCLISSNGVISFDMVTNTPGGSSNWSFASNLPNSTLFLNSIFGVYHDIDPSIGGEVSWELITLNTGCRALVAAWDNIPMFQCNSILYTGQIVLYENTNIIDVYIQEKNVCSTWNGGNAIVGVQNPTGTLATVAPGRNGLDADWTVTNEAWRFVPSGAAITSVKWYQGSGTSGPVVGNTDVISVCPSATTIYTAEVSYSLCNGTTLIETEETTVTVNFSKTWNGSVSTDWNTAANWTPVGVPTSLDCVVIPNVTNDSYITGSSYDAYAYSLSVLNGGLLNIYSANNLTVTNAVNVSAGGTFNIMDDSSLLQINNVANSGNINMERITQPMYRYDFTYWNSPVNQSSGFTLGNLSPLTLWDKYFSWTPSVAGGSGIWIAETSASVMDHRKGYIVRAPQTYSINPAVKVPYTANFIGVPNNGNITCPISYGSMGPAATDDKWNLLGNPYPSAVSAASFLNDPANAAVIDGTIYFWTHNTPWSTAWPDPFYANYVINYTSADYASWNKTGGVGTIASSGGPAPNGYIAAGEAFFVKSLGVPGSATFKNTMRVVDNNSQFFRIAPSAVNEQVIERHRIWLNFTNETGSFNQILVGYVTGATLGWDRGLDGQRFSDSDITFYSLLPDNHLVIQGRPLPFQDTDLVPLGYSSLNPGGYTIRLDHIDGLFNEQNIYLEDKYLHVIHDLKQSPYEFITDAGAFDDRFILRYNNEIFFAKSADVKSNATAFINNEKLSVQATSGIVKITIYDISGKSVGEYSPVVLDTFFEMPFTKPRSAYIAKIEMENGAVTMKKLIN